MDDPVSAFLERAVRTPGRWRSLVRRRAGESLLRSVEIEDILAKSIERALVHRDRVRAVSDHELRAWFEKIIINVIHDLENDEKRRDETITRWTEECSAETHRRRSPATPDQLAQAGELIERVVRELRDLPAESVDLLVSVQLGGESFGSAAERHDRSESAVRSWFYRARGRLEARTSDEADRGDPNKSSRP